VAVARFPKIGADGESMKVSVKIPGIHFHAGPRMT
jgi:hypothetical protein